MTKETEYQLALLEEMIERRMINTGESREDACIHISKYLLGQTTNDKTNNRTNAWRDKRTQALSKSQHQS